MHLKTIKNIYRDELLFIASYALASSSVCCGCLKQMFIHLTNYESVLGYSLCHKMLFDQWDTFL